MVGDDQHELLFQKLSLQERIHVEGNCDHYLLIFLWFSFKIAIKGLSLETRKCLLTRASLSICISPMFLYLSVASTNANSILILPFLYNT